MQITINGQTPQEVSDGITVSELLKEMKLEPLRVAVECNKQIVRRATFPQTTLSDGDQLEIVTLVGGG